MTRVDRRRPAGAGTAGAAPAPKRRRLDRAGAGGRAASWLRWSSWWPYALALASGAWLGAVPALHACSNADALIPTLVSLQARTVYFWRQDRYGMLWPWLLQGVTHPLRNLVAVSAANAAAGLLAQALLCRLLWPGRGAWQLAAAASFAITLSLGTPHYLAETLGPPQFFSTPLTLGLVGLACTRTPTRAAWRPARTLGAVALFATCGWYNPAVPALLGLLVLARFGPALLALRGAWPDVLASPRIAFVLRALVGCALALAFGLVCMRLSPFAQFVPTALTPPWLWPVTLAAVLASARAGGDLPAPFVAALLLGCAAAVARAALGGAWGQGARPAARATLAAAAYLLLVASQGWVRQEGCNGRFLWPACFVLVPVAGGGWVAWLSRAPRRLRQAAVLGLVVGGTTAGLFRLGRPDVAGVGDQLAAHAGELGREGLAANCSHLAGTYWDVWPAVLYVAWQRYEVDNVQPVLGVTQRTEATRHLWNEVPRPWRVCAREAEVNLAGSLLGHFGAPELRQVAAPEAPHLRVAETLSSQR